MSEVRTRIAPSPTGAPHIGTAYIALHNLAFAKNKGGKFILRIEDTDQVRSTKASEEQILDSLKWMGLEWDEGPDVGGEFGPYRQSERLDLYKESAFELVEKGKAYPCFCNKERLDALRAEQMANKQNPGYDGFCRDIKPEEAKERMAKGEAYVIRLLVNKEGETKFFDAVRNQDISFNNAEVDDQVLLKTDGFPTYHLANVVDDHAMKITHVLRGEEWISSTPKHVMLYEAFGWKAPEFMHLPLLRNTDKSKISKRKNPTSLTWFMANGYCKASLQNFLALMGYSMSGDREIFSLTELIKEYDPSRISTSAPIFDFTKLDRFNSQYIMEFSQDEFADYQAEADRCLIEYIKALLPHVLQRIKSRSDLDYWTGFLFERELAYESNSFRIKKLNQEQAQKLLKALAKEMGRSRPVKADDYKEVIAKVASDLELPAASAFMLSRISLMKRKDSLPLAEVMEFLGADICTKRLKEAGAFIKGNWPQSK
ncbi:MAG: glutamate--tRNA ligase [Planctomycetes bacterium]|nr:glutamate--tRNA ligase [Planctomycetota bacterium]